jgi:ketosteroid isomerase-like protein
MQNRPLIFEQRAVFFLQKPELHVQPERLWSSMSGPKVGQEGTKGAGGMQVAMEAVARAFSSHRFEDAVPQLDNDIIWELVGGEALTGKPAVMDVCTSLARDLRGVQTTFDTFRVIVASSSVVVDSVASYVSGDGSVSRVASCDIYDFVDGRVVRIRSYNVELASTT